MTRWKTAGLSALIFGLFGPLLATFVFVLGVAVLRADFSIFDNMYTGLLYIVAYIFWGIPALLTGVVSPWLRACWVSHLAVGAIGAVLSGIPLLIIDLPGRMRGSEGMVLLIAMLLGMLASTALSWLTKQVLSCSGDQPV